MRVRDGIVAFIRRYGAAFAGFSANWNDSLQVRGRALAVNMRCANADLSPVTDLIKLVSEMSSREALSHSRQARVRAALLLASGLVPGLRSE
jgi:hypothetical protein